MSHHHHHHCSIHGDQPCNCSVCSCSSPCHHHHDEHTHDHDGGDFPHQLIEMADDAWMELLREKIKQEVQARSGKKLDELAKIVAESNEERWQHKLSMMEIAHEYADKVHTFFSRKKRS